MNNFRSNIQSRTDGLRELFFGKVDQRLATPNRPFVVVHTSIEFDEDFDKAPGDDPWAGQMDVRDRATGPYWSQGAEADR